jgi:hypothetical protein
VFAEFIGVAFGPSGIDADIAAINPAQLLKRLDECRMAGLRFCVIRSDTVKHSKEPHTIGLLGAGIDRHQRGSAAEQGEQVAPVHVWMAPAPQEILLRVVQVSLAVMCPACWCSPGGLLALMGSANRGLITRTGSLSR